MLARTVGSVVLVISSDSAINIILLLLFAHVVKYDLRSIIFVIVVVSCNSLLSLIHIMKRIDVKVTSRPVRPSDPIWNMHIVVHSIRCIFLGCGSPTICAKHEMQYLSIQNFGSVIVSHNRRNQSPGIEIVVNFKPPSEEDPFDCSGAGVIGRLRLLLSFFAYLALSSGPTFVVEI